MDCFAEFTEYFLPTNKAHRQSASTLPLRREIKGGINKTYDFKSPSGSQNCDYATKKLDRAPLHKKNNCSTNSEHGPET